MTNFVNDAVAQAGQAFCGMAISDSDSGVGNCQLWNPWGSGKLLFLDKVLIDGDEDVGADIRPTRTALSTLYGNSGSLAHIINHFIDNTNLSVAELRIATGTPPNDYPYSYPFQEVWLGGTSNDRPYPFDPTIIIPQGRGVVVAMANNSKCLASFAWREYTDPLGPVTQSGGSGTMVSASEGTIVSNNLTNPANCFDTNDSTYANDPNDGNVTNYYIGKTWSASKTITRFVIRSEPGRSFSAANPGRVLGWVLEKFDGTTWTTHQSGSYTEPGTGSTQSSIDVTLTTTAAALGHRIHITEATGVSTQHVATVEFYV